MGREVGCRLTADTVVGIDAAFLSAESVARQSDETTLIEGAPVLAVEVLSPSDKVEEINEKITACLAHGSAIVWIVDPYIRTLQVHRPKSPPEMFNVAQSLSGGDVSPGLEIAVAEPLPDATPSADPHELARG